MITYGFIHGQEHDHTACNATKLACGAQVNYGEEDKVASPKLKGSGTWMGLKDPIQHALPELLAHGTGVKRRSVLLSMGK
jgi:hypothetical protein